MNGTAESELVLNFAQDRAKSKFSQEHCIFEIDKISIFPGSGFRIIAVYMDLFQGKIELELHLLKKEEAEESPVGLGRKGPDPLPEPK